MDIIEKQKKYPTSKVIPVRNISASEEISDSQTRIIEEISVHVYLNGTFCSDIPCTPEHLPELTAGWFLTERNFDIAAFEGTLEVQGGGEDDNLTVQIEIPSVPFQECAPDMLTVYGKSKDNDSLKVGRTAFNKAVLSNAENRAWIYTLMERFEVERPLRKATKSSHSCMLVHLDLSEDMKYRDLKVLYQSEDTGRHSAMDKAIGWGVLNRIDMTKCILFTSGRISGDMAKKASASGVLCLVTAKPLLTTGAVDEAKRNNMLLAGIDTTDREITFI